MSFSIMSNDQTVSINLDRTPKIVNARNPWQIISISGDGKIKVQKSGSDIVEYFLDLEIELFDIALYEDLFRFITEKINYHEDWFLIKLNEYAFADDQDYNYVIPGAAFYVTYDNPSANWTSNIEAGDIIYIQGHSRAQEFEVIAVDTTGMELLLKALKYNKDFDNNDTMENYSAATETADVDMDGSHWYPVRLIEIPDDPTDVMEKKIKLRLRLELLSL